MNTTLSLFDSEIDQVDYLPDEDKMTIVDGDPSIVSGLRFIPEFITAGEERVLLWEADREGEWSTHWSRRTKSFGSAYQQSVDSAGNTLGIKSLPGWSEFVRRRLIEQSVLSKEPNQMGINEYKPGQGIAPHVDYFRGAVVSLTLGSGCVMDFSLLDAVPGAVSLWLPRRSIVVLTGDARTIWRHGIKGRLKDIVNGNVVRRNRRLSLTFRDVVIDK